MRKIVFCFALFCLGTAATASAQFIDRNTAVVGTDTFRIKKVQLGACFGKGPASDELWCNNYNVDVEFGVMSMWGEPYEVLNLYANPDNPKQVVLKVAGTEIGGRYLIFYEKNKGGQWKPLYHKKA